MSKTKGHNRGSSKTTSIQSVDLWSRRPCNYLAYSKYNRKLTIRKERVAERALIHNIKKYSELAKK